jgi:hypothetical protein
MGVLLLVAATVHLCGCGDQAVVWNVANPIDFAKGYSLDVESDVAMPSDELEFMETNITEELDKVFHGPREGPGNYSVAVRITRYDEGSSGARFMLAGLGQMYLDGDVRISVGDPPVIVRSGQFKKNFSGGGIIGATATMKDDMVAKVGRAIAEGLKRSR